jgi:hypothetical protein
MHSYQYVCRDMLQCNNKASILLTNTVLLRRKLKVFRGQHYQQQQQKQQHFYPFRSLATTTTTTITKDAEYKNFSHQLLTIDHGHPPPSSTRDMPQQQQQQPKDKLVFGKQFTPHMLQIQYINQQWGAPKIVPYQNLSISPAASSLHYGT